MKKNILLLSLLIAGSNIAFAQCGKKIIFISSKTEHLDGDKVERAVDEKTVIETNNKGEITITPGEETNKMTGTIKSDTCSWKTPFTEGKSIIKALITDEHGDAKNVTLTIEGKEGKITLLAEVDEMPGKKIRVTADKFEEKK